MTVHDLNRGVGHDFMAPLRLRPSAGRAAVAAGAQLGGTMLLKDCAGADRATILLLKAFLRRAGSLRYTGRVRDANKLVHILPLYTAFVLAHVEYMREMYGYELRRATPGQKARIFAPFRDSWLPQALRELRAEANKVAVDQIEPTAYLYKKNQRLRKGKT